MLTWVEAWRAIRRESSDKAGHPDDSDNWKVNVEVMDIVIILIAVMVSWVYTYVKTYQVVHLKNVQWDFPGGLVGKTSHSQCRGPGFDPWSGN